MKKCMRWRNCLLFVSLLASGAVQAYPGELHQQLTFLAAKQVSRCDAIWSQAQDSQPAEKGTGDARIAWQAVCAGYALCGAGQRRKIEE